MRVFFQGKELEEEPGRELQSLLEFVDKLNSPSVVDLDSMNELEHFMKFYGENSLLMVYEEKDSEFYKCVRDLVEDKYKMLFYVGSIRIDKYYDEKEGKNPILMVKLGNLNNSSLKLLFSF